MLSIKMLRKLVITNKKDLSLLKLNGFTDFDIVQLTIRNSYIYKVGFFVSVLLVNYIALIILEFSIEQIVFWLIVIALLFIAVILEQVLILYLCVKRVKPEYFYRWRLINKKRTAKCSFFKYELSYLCVEVVF